MKYYIESKLFRIKEDFWIKNQYGEEVFFVNRKLFSFGLEFDMIKSNRVLYSVKENIFTFLSKYEVSDNVEVVAKINEKLSFFRDNIKVDSKYGELIIKGDLFDYNYKIYKDDVIIASVQRELFAFSDNYNVCIDFEDEPFILTLVIIIDNLKDKHKN